ncbi:MAG TPA: class I SAM-dependent methyltransferase [Stellaceae bacterium]|nr:class I SAM-dependent methyltransferase [Stellaceae bacterium]
MAHIETLSTTAQTDFTEVWYDIADENHFWLRWRFAFFLREIRRLSLDPALPMTGLDVGCGHGAVGRQLAAQTAWQADGCDLNQAALALHSASARRVFYYDINDRYPSLREKYDFLVMFDVIEHIEKTRPFLEAAIYHLKPGGHVFVNVPACQRLYSRYDVAAGHYRRYDKPLLREQFEEAGLEVRSMHYWGAFLLPALAARKLIVDGKNASDDIIRTGFHPPNRFASTLLSVALACENLLPPLPVGSSLLAVARKPGAS